MSKVKEFYEALSKDEAMQERAKGLKAVGETTAEAAAEAVVAFAKSEGYAFTAEELKDFSKELSEQELAAVAGGNDIECITAGTKMTFDKNGRMVHCWCFLMGFSVDFSCAVIFGL
jgi:predicted ribosomally synthesized peptide with nif11-like leader